MSGRKILEGLRDALNFMSGDRTAGRMLQYFGKDENGVSDWRDVSADWLLTRGIPSKPARLTVVATPPGGPDRTGGAADGGGDDG